MRLISSRSTFYSKRVFPILWFGMIGVQVIVLLRHFPEEHFPLPAILVPLFMATIGYILFKRLLFDLVDQVWDDGDTLVVRNASREERIPLANILNVGYSNSGPTASPSCSASRAPSAKKSPSSPSAGSSSFPGTPSSTS